MKKNATIYPGRQEAAVALSASLLAYVNANAVVIGINNEGMYVAGVVSAELNIPLEYVPCHAIEHPRKENIFIGSICDSEIFLHDFSPSVTKVLSAQLSLSRKTIEYENFQFYSENRDIDLRYKTVILCTDIIQTTDSVIACIHRLKRESPLKIVLATVVGLESVMADLSEEVDEIVCLKTATRSRDVATFISSLPAISNRRVKQILNESIACAEFG